MKKIPRTAIVILVVLLILIADQAIKIWVKTNMSIYESIHVTSWFEIKFVENNGMAFGLEVINKLFLTLFRLIAVGFIVYYLRKIIAAQYNRGYIVCISLILAGAFGNIIDCVFYGEIFTESPLYNIHFAQEPAQLVAVGEGYGTWLHGKVVDMFYFPIINTTFPSWVPIVGGRPFEFFNAIFNLADSAISVGIVVLLLFYRKTLTHSLHEEEKNGDSKK
ncbi:MAG: lipoprotein signal peptidase [Dysgonomonas sp.]